MIAAFWLFCPEERGNCREEPACAWRRSSGILGVEQTQAAATRGMFRIRVRVSNPTDRYRSFEENSWVDSGAPYSFVPEGRLIEIGISPLP